MENILDYLVPIIIFLVFILPKLLKKRVSTQKPEADQPQKANPTIFSKLNTMLEDYYEEEKAGAPQEPQEHPEEEAALSWLNRSDETEPEVTKPQPVVETKTAKIKVEEQQPEAKRAEIKEPPEMLQNPAGIPPRLGKPRKQELRNAIVWSEILAPPLALREK